ncbi:hypothetical protein AX15_003864 [Amanita polypyramis BW_CC]|nr:hypothetical protein AX15_003864 [Amanita polypyramis BW_CC]
MRAILRSVRPFPPPRRPFPRLPPARLASSFPLSSQPDTEPADEPDDAEKPKLRRTRVSAPPTKDADPIELPDGLHILWSTEHDLLPDSHADALPPPELLEDSLNNLQITLHPYTQHRATYSTPLGSPIEPTLGLYCPIEGGDYVIDATVRELAFRTGAEVLVLDSVQLAAGEWGQFGKAANTLQLPRNPLHFSSSFPSPPPSSRLFVVEDENDSDNSSQIFSPPQQMTVALMPSPAMQGRTIMATPRRTAPPSRIKVFFDTLVNLPSKQDSSETSSSSSRPRPRLIYIRDFPTLAPSASSWYPHLLSAVRQRRRGPISRPSSPITNPITIIFGMTPAIAPHTSPSSSGPENSLPSTPLSRGSSHLHARSSSRYVKSDCGEDEASEKAREKRLRERLRKWEKGDVVLHDEFAKLTAGSDLENASDAKPEIVIIGAGNGFPGFVPILNSLSGQNGKVPEPESKGFFFRASTLIPQTRSPSLEQSTRIARRREVNELTMRMGVGAVGGCVQRERASDVLPQIGTDAISPSSDQDSRMWDSWGKSLEPWVNVRTIADRALGSVMSSFATQDKLDKGSLEPTKIPWPVVQNAWLADRSMRDLRKVWLKEVAAHGKEDEEEVNRTQAETDELIERVRNDSNLDVYEQRLLPCIVNAASMSTSFSQVHLPAHTVDSVRTIVSLPLLQPQAFQQGILKEHGMTGCLLFGPPGTGKTLVVRALAKEVGCRMMMVSPSDVMDMYVGEGEKLVRAVFSLARRLSPCVIFLDEIDALFGARMSSRESGGAFAHRGVITEFMQEMDGLVSSREDRVIVIGATNRPFDLDDAVLRRLPRRLLVDLPGEKEREGILEILLRDEKLGDDVDIRNLAGKTESFSGSDLKHLCVSAALDAVKENVQLPWSKPQQTSTSPDTPIPGLFADVALSPTELPSPSGSVAPGPESEGPTQSRILYLHNFLKALKEITPSSSESLGSLAELRKWNEEFGEGHKDKKRQQVWGKGRFGFTKGSDEPPEERLAGPVSIDTTTIR